MLRAKTKEQKEHILEILGTGGPISYFPLDFEKETDVGYMEHNDRVYIDGNISFDKMAEIVDYLRLVSKQSIEQQEEAIKRASKLLQMAFVDTNEENLAIIKVAEKEKDVDFFACALSQLEKTCIELKNAFNYKIEQ